MGRPRSDYKIGYCPPYGSFKPTAWECNEYVDITPEEIESLRLKNLKNLDQTTAAEKMGISQSTFQRILNSAYKKVSQAIIEGKELRILKEKAA
jgi:predicted DNA-binding protein (UPF0251 family)